MTEVDGAYKHGMYRYLKKKKKKSLRVVYSVKVFAMQDGWTYIRILLIWIKKI